MRKVLHVSWVLGAAIAVGIGLVTLYQVGHPLEALGQALRITTAPQGGTGIGSAVVGDIGNCLKVLSDSPFTYELGSCGTGGGGGGAGFPTYVQNGGATLNSGATTTFNFTSNSFALNESPADTFAIRIATTTLGLLTTNVAEGSNLYYTDARVSAYMSASSTYTDLLSFYTTPSTRITAGTGVDWSGNTLNGVYTAGDALTLTGEDFDFDGGATPSGDLGGTWASPSVSDDSHAHTGTTLSGIDISSDTNLAGDSEVVLTGDALSLASTITRDTELSSFLTTVDISANTNLAGDTEVVLTGDALSLGNALTFTTGTSSTAFQTALLGVGSDYISDITGTGLTLTNGVLSASGGAGGGSNWLYNGSRLSPSTTVGIGVFASSTIGGGTGASGLTVDGNATATGRFIAPLGSVSEPTYSFSTSLSSGMYMGNTSQINLAVSGVNEVLLASTQMQLTTDGTQTIPAFAIGGDSNTGLFQTSDEELRFSLNGTERMALTTTGLGIGTSTPSRKLTVQGGDSWFGGNMTGTGTLDIAGLATLAYASTTGTSGTNLNFTAATATTLFAPTLLGTNATTTSFGVLSLNSASCDVKATTGGGLYCGIDQAGSGAGLATSGPIADTEVIYGTSVSTVDSEAAYTYNATTDLLTIPNSTTTNATTTRLAVTNSFNFLGSIITNVSTWFNGLFDTQFATKNIDDLADVGALSETTGDVLMWNGSAWTDTATNTLGLGTVTSVAMSVPTGLSIAGTPITTAGTLALTYASGYEGFLSSASTTLFGFYNTPSTRISDGTGLTWSGNTLNVDTTQNISTLSNLTSNGFVKTSGGTGALSIDTTTYESGLTAGDGLTRTVNDFDCDTASGSIFGCLLSADWTIFNNKVSSTSIDTSAELAALLTDETGTGNVVLSASPTFTGGATFSGIRATASSTLAFASSTALTVSGNTYLGSLNGLLKGTSGAVGTASNGTDYTLITGTTCGGTDKVSAVLANGTVTCSTDVSGGGAGSISTSSVPVAGNLAYWTSGSALSDVATGTLTETVTGLELSATRGLVGGSAILALTTGFTVPTTSSTTEWGTFYQTPSTRISAGTGVDWSGNTINGVYTAGDALTLTGEDFDFDGGATPAGALGGTWASPTVDDDGHAHTGATISGIDISSDTNLAGDTEIVLTGDALSIASTITRDTELSSFLTTVDISANTNLTADGTEIVLTNDALSLGTALTFLTGTSTTSFFSGLGTFTNTVVNTLLTAAAATFTGLVDIGAGILEIPNGANPTANDVGEIAHDTTDNQLIMDDFVVRSKDEIYTFSYGSTSVPFQSGNTKALPVKEDGFVVSDIYCFVEGGTSKAMTLFGESITCDADGAVDDGSIAIATVAAASTTVLTTAGATTGNVNYVNITVTGTYTRE